MRAVIKGQGQNLTVGALPVGTLFKVASQISERTFVKCGDGLSTPSAKYGRKGGKKLKGSNSSQPPVYAIIVPTEGRFDRRAFTPAGKAINANTPVVSTFGTLVLSNA